MKSTILAVIAALSASAAQPSAFETAAISKSRSSSSGFSAHVEAKPGQPVRLTFQNVSLKLCIQLAFSVKEYQITAPGWIQDARYDIEATLAPGAPAEQVWPALQTLLAERLKLATRREQKELLIYELTVAQNGPKMRAASAGRPTGMGYQPGGGSMRRRADTNGTLRMNGASIAEFCAALSRSANHPLLDATGLPGTFDFEFEYGGSGRSSSAMSKALEKQLGLRVEPKQAMVEMLIVERALRKPLAR